MTEHRATRRCAYRTPGGVGVSRRCRALPPEALVRWVWRAVGIGLCALSGCSLLPASPLDPPAVPGDVLVRTAIPSEWREGRTSRAGLTDVDAVRGDVAADLVEDDAAWIWGRRALAPGLPGQSARSPERLGGLPVVDSVAVGLNHGLALSADGRVWTWGDPIDPHGAEPASARTPVPVAGLDAVVAIAAGDAHSLALRADGTVWAWGRNSLGQLGDGTREARAMPVRVVGLHDAVAIAAGSAHNLALLADGTVRAWGSGSFGSLGHGTQAGSSVPVPVRDLHDVTALAAGGRHSLAVRRDGTVWTWGYGLFGRLIDDSNALVVPLQVDDVRGAIGVAAGWSHSLVLTEDGRVWAWGYNLHGELGDGTLEHPRSTPHAIPGLRGVVAVAAGEHHSLALKGDGTVWAWGSNGFGQLGTNPGVPLHQATPIWVPGIRGVRAIGAHGLQSVAVGSAMAPRLPRPRFLPAAPDGDAPGVAAWTRTAVWHWGSYQPSALGEALRRAYARPAIVPGLADVDALATGAHHSLALTGDGRVWIWGDMRGCEDPDNVVPPTDDPRPVAGLRAVVAVAAGYCHNLALRRDGSVWAWGYNGAGQLGNGTRVARDAPTRVAGLAGVRALAAGSMHSLALDGDGTVWIWGHVAPRSTESRWTSFITSPMAVPQLSEVVAIAAARSMSFALKQDGTVWGWGVGAFAEEPVRPVEAGPEQVPGLSEITALAVGAEHRLALHRDGTVWVWGRNDAGQLGLGASVAAQPRPAPLPGLSGVVAIAAGERHSLALKGDGTVWAWGYQGAGAVGDGLLGELIRHEPTQVPGLERVTAIAANWEHSLALQALPTPRLPAAVFRP